MVVRGEDALAVRHQEELEELPEDAIDGSVTMSRALAVSAHGLTLNEARLSSHRPAKVPLLLRQGWLCESSRNSR
jgi:hypothetical protein